MKLFAAMRVRRWKKVVGGSEGSEIAEAALVLPLAFLILLAIYWFGRAFNVYATINHAAREGARVGVTSSCGSCGNSATTAATVAGVVTATLQNSNVDYSKISLWSPTPTFCSGGTVGTNCDNTNYNITVCTQVQLAANSNSGQGPPVCGVSVTFEYPYTFSLPYPASGVALQLKADVQMRAEN